MQPRFQRLTILLLAFVLLAGHVAPIRPAQAQSSAGDYVPREVIVRLLPPLLGSVNTLLNSITSQLGLQVLDQLGTLPIFRLKLLNNLLSVEQIINLLQAIPGVLYAEPNYIGQTPESVARYSWFKGDEHGDYEGQWAADIIRLSEAHTVSRGAGVTVAVLDTGVDLDHPALAGRLVPGFDFVDFDPIPAEEGIEGVDAAYGHGTHVAGLIALAAPEAKIRPLRVLGPDGRGSSWLVAQTVRYAAGLPTLGLPLPTASADVISISYSVPKRSLLLDDVLKLVGSLPGGPVVVAAAGNSGPSTAPEYPAAETLPSVLAVAASTSSDTLATFSTRGNWVDVAAPGENILSSLPDDDYGTWSGTSMATPLAAGTAALVIAKYPNLTSSQVVSRIVSKSATIPGDVPRRIDAARALDLP
jgi:thermitase